MAGRKKGGSSSGAAAVGRVVREHIRAARRAGDDGDVYTNAMDRAVKALADECSVEQLRAAWAAMHPVSRAVGFFESNLADYADEPIPERDALACMIAWAHNMGLPRTTARFKAGWDEMFRDMASSGAADKFVRLCRTRGGR